MRLRPHCHTGLRVEFAGTHGKPPEAADADGLGPVCAKESAGIALREEGWGLSSGSCLI